MRCLALLLLAVSTVVSAPVIAKDVANDNLAHNKAVASSFFDDVLDQGKLEDYAKSHAPDFFAHSEGGKASLEDDMTAAREQRKAMPDMRVKVDHMVAEGDLVSVHWSATGTNTAAGWGIPATGKKVSVSGMTLFRFERGLIQEEWSVFNLYSLFKQLGLLPPQG